MGDLERYFSKKAEGACEKSAVAYVAMLDHLREVHPQIAEAVVRELHDQRSNLKLIASENYSSLSTQLAMGTLLTDKYSEGHLYHRFYAGCENIDAVECIAMEEAKALFQCDHAYVQPHSGSDANLVAFWAILVQKIQNREMERLGVKSIFELSPEEYETIRQLMVSQKVMGMSMCSGGHLTHGYLHNVSAKMMSPLSYEVDLQTGELDYSALAKQVKRERPLILIAGYSAYPKLINFAKMREIAESVDAILLADMAHFAGLVAGKVIVGEYNPIPYAHIVTTTTHKTLRGPRGGMILCQKEFRENIDKGCPLVLGGPLPHVMAAKAIALREANCADFQRYARQVVDNARALAGQLLRRGMKLITGGTENHLMVCDLLSSVQMTGKQGEEILRQALMTVNRNLIPGDVQPPWHTSGIRLGTPALTTLGMREKEMRKVADLIADLLKASRVKLQHSKEKLSSGKAIVDKAVLERVRGEVKSLLAQFFLYPQLPSISPSPSAAQ